VITEAIWTAQGAGPVVGVVLVAGAICLVVNRLMRSDAKPLLHGYVDNTKAAQRWSEAMRPKETPRLRGGAR
jgi:hypothetical protein